MPTFFDLPREVRDEIYTEVLNYTLLPTSSTQKCKKDGPKLPFVSSLPLLLTNHQVHTETSWIIAQFRSQGKLHYKLSFTDMNGGKTRMHQSLGSTATWLSLPAHSWHVDVLEITFFTTSEQERGYGTLFPQGNWPEQIMYELLGTVEYFLRYGPDFQKQQKACKNISVDQLAINIIPVSIDLTAEAQTAAQSWGQSGRKHLGLEAVVDVMASSIEHQLKHGNEWSSNGIEHRLVLDRVQRITFALEGSLRKEMDVAVLACLRIASIPLFRYVGKFAQ